MRHLRVLASAATVGLAALLVAPVPASATGIPARGGVVQGPWTGTSTNVAGDFSYGQVSFTVARGVVKDFIIEGVTVSGCGGYKSIVVPRLTIKGSSISGSYDPVPGVQDTITVKARFAAGVIRGTFTEGPTCVGAGRFVARPGG